MSDLDLYKKVNIEKIAAAGKKIYEKIKDQYEPKYNGRYLAIEVKTSEVFLGKDGVEATQKAKKKFPEEVFYLVKIGFTTAEAVAKMYFR